MNTYQYLENQDVSTSGKWFRIILSPIWLLLEYLTYRYQWKIIVSEFIENDKIFDFIDKNEFGLKFGKFIKKDLIDNVEFLRGRNIEESKKIIKDEYSETLRTLIQQNSNFNLGEIISLLVNIEVLLTKDKQTGEIYKNNVYSVSIQYIRLWWLNKAIQYTIVWFIFISIISGLIYWIIQFNF